LNNLSRRLLVTFALFAASILHAERKAPFSLSVGTQTIDAKYSFTDEPMLIETAKVIREMGSDTLKISLTSRYSERYGIAENPAIQSVRDLIEKEPSYRQAFAMPFRNIMFWLYPFAKSSPPSRRGAIPEGGSGCVSTRRSTTFTAYLLKEYSGSGKSFFIGNWEGDWHLTKVSTTLRSMPARPPSREPSNGSGSAKKRWPTPGATPRMTMSRSTSTSNSTMSQESPEGRPPRHRQPRAAPH
jgi:hypothetical protein